MDRAAKRRQARATKDTNPLTMLIWSNMPGVGTGYGTQTEQVVPRFQADGHHVAVSVNYGLQGMRTEWNGVPMYPMGMGGYGEDIVGANFADWTRQHPDGVPHVLVIFDAWVLKSKHWDEMPTSIWTMVDHRPVPPAVFSVLQKPNITPLAASRFAQTEIERLGVEAVYIPMAIDTEVYKPTLSALDRTGRELMGFGNDAEDFFVVSFVNANKAAGPAALHRKAWAEQLLAFSIFAQDKPDVRAYLHTELHGNHGGLNIPALLKAVGLDDSKVKWANQWGLHNGVYTNEAMAAIYTASDLLSASTLGEGFGLTTLEAAACELPVVVNNFTCQPEMISEDGYLTEGQPYWDGAQLAWFNVPNIASIVDAYEQAYAKGRVRSKKQRAHAMLYDADLIWETRWRPYLASLGA
jgi:glycosyltransferase involved in cell wall biosynthesis